MVAWLSPFSSTRKLPSLAPMDKLSGLLLDRTDDPTGSVLTEMGLKLASAEPPDTAPLRDEVFALCIRQDGAELRKYAMHTAESTAESIAYFLKQGHLLPDEARKVAASNLLVGASWYGLQPPETLRKIAMLGSAAKWVGGKALQGAKSFGSNLLSNPVGTAMGAVGAVGTASALAGGASQVKQNLGQVAGQGGNIVPLHTFG